MGLPAESTTSISLGWRGELCCDFRHFVSRPRHRVEDNDRDAGTLVLTRARCRQRCVDDLIASAADVFEIALCLQIIHADAGAGHDVVELVEEEIFPFLLKQVLRIGFAV